MSPKSALMSLLVITVTACTQAPAPVAYNENIMISKTRSLAALAPASGGSKVVQNIPSTVYANAPTVDVARVESVNVSELPSPNASATRKTAYMWPVEGKVIVPYGRVGKGKSNDGINISAADGTPVRAAAGGEVAYTGNKLKSFGNMVIIRHADGKNTTYAHLRRIATSKGDTVKQGEVIGYVGKTGDVTRPQLHFALREGVRAMNPENYLSKTYADMR